MKEEGRRKKEEGRRKKLRVQVEGLETLDLDLWLMADA
jgi:hypothetical protein